MKLNQMFPNRFLRGQDMTRAYLIVLLGVATEKVRAGAGKPEETKYVLRFELAKDAPQPQTLDGTNHPQEGYGLILRKTLSDEIFSATGTQDTDQWPACKVVIEAHKEKAAGREVMCIHARKPAASKPATTQPDAKTTETTPSTGAIKGGR